MAGRDLHGEFLEGEDFHREDLSDADLRGAHLNDADLTDANLSNATLDGDFCFARFNALVRNSPERSSSRAERKADSLGCIITGIR